jgi:hypothetical protein
LNIDPADIETSDAQREDGKMTSEDSYMIRTDIMVYLEDDADVIFILDWGDADGILGSLGNIRLLKRIPEKHEI